MSDTDRRDAAAQAKAELSFNQALWYAWGRMDSGQYQGFPLNVWRFADSVKAATLAFEKEQTYHLESIQGAWEKFVVRESS